MDSLPQTRERNYTPPPFRDEASLLQEDTRIRMEGPPGPFLFLLRKRIAKDSAKSGG